MLQHMIFLRHKFHYEQQIQIDLQATNHCSNIFVFIRYKKTSCFSQLCGDIPVTTMAYSELLSSGKKTTVLCVTKLGCESCCIIFGYT